MARLLTLIVALLASALVAFPAVAQQEVEIIPLQHRFPDEVIPQLRPFVESGGVLQGPTIS